MNTLVVARFTKIVIFKACGVHEHFKVARVVLAHANIMTFAKNATKLVVGFLAVCGIIWEFGIHAVITRVGSIIVIIKARRNVSRLHEAGRDAKFLVLAGLCRSEGRQGRNEGEAPEEHDVKEWREGWPCRFCGNSTLNLQTKPRGGILPAQKPNPLFQEQYPAGAN